ncbi:potassium channel family protein [Microbacterium sp. NPDC088619]|uniref:potassium channel family protein n=1 Tax=Microbacterium sp. NPDC088619 TaxID=3364196 RepID=UPI0038093ADE
MSGPIADDSSPADAETTLDRWESAATVPLTVLGLGFIVAYSVLVLVPDLPAWVRIMLGVEIAITWLALVVDLIVRVVLTPAGGRIAFLVHHPIEVLSVLVPLFRAFRVVELARGLPYFHRRTGNAVRAQIITFALAYTVLFVYFISLATLQVERGAPDATIVDFGTAIWWACVTIATVGYGDTYPVTTLGRVYAVCLMIGGIAIVGTTSALVISYIGDRVRRITHREETREEV